MKDEEKQGKPYFTSRDGVVGTVHMNRHGAEVDFRPATITLDAGWGRGEEGIQVTPAKAVDLDPVILDAQVETECEKETTFVATFVGVTVRVTQPGWARAKSFKETQEEEAERNRLRLMRALADEELNKEARRLLDTPSELLRRAAPTHRELGRLSSPYANKWWPVLERLVDRVLVEDLPDQMKRGGGPRLLFEKGKEARDAMLSLVKEERKAKVCAWGRHRQG